MTYGGPQVDRTGSPESFRIFESLIVLEFIADLFLRKTQPNELRFVSSLIHFRTSLQVRSSHSSGERRRWWKDRP